MSPPLHYITSYKADLSYDVEKYINPANILSGAVDFLSNDVKDFASDFAIDAKDFIFDAPNLAVNLGVAGINLGVAGINIVGNFAENTIWEAGLKAAAISTWENQFFHKEALEAVQFAWDTANNVLEFVWNEGVKVAFDYISNTDFVRFVWDDIVMSDFIQNNPRMKFLIYNIKEGMSWSKALRNYGIRNLKKMADGSLFVDIANWFEGAGKVIYNDGNVGGGLHDALWNHAIMHDEWGLMGLMAKAEKTFFTEIVPNIGLARLNKMGFKPSQMLGRGWLFDEDTDLGGIGDFLDDGFHMGVKFEQNFFIILKATLSVMDLCPYDPYFWYMWMYEENGNPQWMIDTLKDYLDVWACVVMTTPSGGPCENGTAGSPEGVHEGDICSTDEGRMSNRLDRLGGGDGNRAENNMVRASQLDLIGSTGQTEYYTKSDNEFLSQFSDDDTSGAYTNPLINIYKKPLYLDSTASFRKDVNRYLKKSFSNSRYCNDVIPDRTSWGSCNGTSSYRWWFSI